MLRSVLVAAFSAVAVVGALGGLADTKGDAPADSSWSTTAAPADSSWIVVAADTPGDSSWIVNDSSWIVVS